MKERPALRKKIDGLYAGPRVDFVAERNALAKGLKADGHGDEADHVRGLAKPTVAAALLNRVARESSSELKAFAKAAASLRKASGSAKGERLRAAAKAERKAAGDVLAAAEAAAGEGGGGAGSRAVLDRVIETLQAAAADPELEALLVAGRVDRERSSASIGLEMDLDVGPPAGGRADVEETPAERKRNERARAKAAKAVARAGHDLAAAESARKTAARAVEGAENRLAEAEEGLDGARKAAEEADAEVDSAGRALRERERELADLD